MQLPLAVAALLAVVAHVAVGVLPLNGSDKTHVAVGGESVHSSDNGHAAAGEEKINPSDMHDNPKLPKGAAVGIRDHANGGKEVLLIHPQKNGDEALKAKGMTFVRGSGKTIFKDGKMVDETSAETAMRELREETGYTGTHDKAGKVVEVTTKKDGKVQTLKAHVIHVPSGPPKEKPIKEDAHEYRWVLQDDVRGHFKQDHFKQIANGFPELFGLPTTEKAGPHPSSSRHEPAEVHQHAITHPRAPARHPHAPVVRP